MRRNELKSFRRTMLDALQWAIVWQIVFTVAILTNVHGSQLLYPLIHWGMS